VLVEAGFIRLIQWRFLSCLDHTVSNGTMIVNGEEERKRPWPVFR